MPQPAVSFPRAETARLPDDGASARADPDQRVTARLDCDRAVQVWTTESQAPMWGQLEDLSLAGCYVKLGQPPAKGSMVRLLLLLYGVKVRAEGTVRWVDLGSGMGVQFCKMSPGDLDQLQAILLKMEPDTSRQLPVLAPAVMMERHNAWFKTHPTLSAEDFQRLRSLPVQ